MGQGRQRALVAVAVIRTSEVVIITVFVADIVTSTITPRVRMISVSSGKYNIISSAKKKSITLYLILTIYFKVPVMCIIITKQGHLTFPLRATPSQFNASQVHSKGRVPSLALGIPLHCKLKRCDDRNVRSSNILTMYTRCSVYVGVHTIQC